MSCTGNCFDVVFHETPTILDNPSVGNQPKSIVGPSEAYSYTPLKPWQTRILCLHPSQASPFLEDEKPPLSADLFVATVSDTEGIVIEQTGEIIEYTALSYTWGYPTLSETLICNKKRRMISSSNAAALVALRSPIEPVYVWIDAICINQDDAEEKSAQVARMLNIYRKAHLVVAWLGEPDGDSLLAFACCRKLVELRTAVSNFRSTMHGPACLERLKAIYLAIRSLYDRPYNKANNGVWLGRTWVRQEIYASRNLVVLCGSDRIQGVQYIRAANLMRAIERLPDHEFLIPKDQCLQSKRLLDEAWQNIQPGPGGSKPPRDLVDVLVTSREFQVTDPRDAFYAVLGMCSVTAFTKATAEIAQYERDAVLVDYSKSLAQVYHDASLCILHRQGDSTNLAKMWSHHMRSPLHDEGLPSWAIDWRDRRMRDPGSCKSGLDTSYQPHPHLQVPLYSDHTFHQRVGAWSWPVPHDSNPSILHLKARVLNYVACLTSYTCSPDTFYASWKNSHIDWRYLGVTGQSIHCKKKLQEPGFGYALLGFDFEWEHYVPGTHAWRLAILGVGNDSQFCLVPSTTEKGDLVVAVAPNTPAIVITPKSSDGTAGGLIPLHDPYENTPEDTFPACRLSYTTLTVIYWVASAILVLGSFICTQVTFRVASSSPESRAATVVTACWGVANALLLSARVLTKYHTGFQSPDKFSTIFNALFLVSVNAFGFVTAIEKRPRETEPYKKTYSIYYGITMMVLVVDILLHTTYKINCAMEIALRRREVFSVLDNAAEAVGQDYEFRGPVAGFEYTRRGLIWGRCTELRIRGLRWCVFKLAVLLNNRNKSRPRLGSKDFAWFMAEVYIDPKRERLSVWHRPTQDFMLY